MGNGLFFVLSFLGTLPFAVAGALYVKSPELFDLSQYASSVESTEEADVVEKESIVKIRQYTERTDQSFKSLSQIAVEGREPRELDPDFDQEAAHRRLDEIKRNGNFEDPEVMQEFADKVRKLRQAEELGY